MLARKHENPRVILRIHVKRPGVAAGLRNPRQEDPWDLLASQVSLIEEFQSKERP